MRVLVCGASGLVGLKIVEQLAQTEHDVRTFSRSRQKIDDLNLEDIDVFVGDARDRADIDAAMSGIDVVVSVIGASLAMSPSPLADYDEVDFRCNQRIFQAATAADVRRIVYLSVSGSEGYEQTEYVQSHRRAEQALRQSGVPSCVVQATGLFGTLAELVNLARLGCIPVMGNGQSPTNPVDESEVAAVCVAAIDDGPECIKVGGPEILSRRQIAELAREASGRKAWIVHLPRWLMVLMSFVYWPVFRRFGNLVHFVTLVSTSEAVTESVGSRRLKEYFQALVDTGRGAQ